MKGATDFSIPKCVNNHHCVGYCVSKFILINLLSNMEYTIKIEPMSYFNTEPVEKTITTGKIIDKIVIKKRKKFKKITCNT